jgi:hypothetical protein
VCSTLAGVQLRRGGHGGQHNSVHPSGTLMIASVWPLCDGLKTGKSHTAGYPSSTPDSLLCCRPTCFGIGTSSAPRLRHAAFALSCMAVIFDAAQGVRASAEPARPLVARPGRVP